MNDGACHVHRSCREIDVTPFQSEQFASSSSFARYYSDITHIGRNGCKAGQWSSKWLPIQIALRSIPAPGASLPYEQLQGLESARPSRSLYLDTLRFRRGLFPASETARY